MTATYTNPETGKTMTVTVHGAYRIDGEAFLTVNKGTARSPMTFGVKAAHTDWVLA